MWFIYHGIELLIGFFIGYLVFERPQWATKVTDRVKAWFKRNLGGWDV